MSPSCGSATYLLELPLRYYSGYVRLHEYGLSRQSFGKWFGDSLLSLTVETGNAPAIAVYLKAGFTVYGVDREVLLIDGKFYDELLMAAML